jgi:N-methylhydantoinase A
MRRILVPPRPGAFSALGLLCTDVVHDYIRSELSPLEEIMPEHAEAIFAALELKARDELMAEGMGTLPAHFLRELDMRYTGQGYELRTPLDSIEGAIDAKALIAVREKFDLRHAQIHGHAAKECSVEVVSYRVRVRVPVPKYRQCAEPAPARPRPIAEAVKGQRDIWFDWRKPERATIYERDRLDIGVEVDGPAVVEQLDATTIIPLNWRARVDETRNLILEKYAQ